MPGKLKSSLNEFLKADHISYLLQSDQIGDSIGLIIAKVGSDEVVAPSDPCRQQPFSPPIIFQLCVPDLIATPSQDATDSQQRRRKHFMTRCSPRGQLDSG